MICKNCKSSNIKSRTNYSHGSKSKSTTSFMCIECRSTNVEAPQDNFRKKKKGRR